MTSGLALAAATHGAIAGQRPRAQTEAWAERRRNILKRRAAIAAALQRGGFDSQPLATGGTFSVQALHSPAGQILHRPSSEKKCRRKGDENSSHPAGTRPSNTEKLA